MHKKPLVSIIMPAYNAANTIHDSIKSVLAQSYDNWELLIINDRSADSTSEIIRSYAKNDQRITPMTNLNKGVSIARNLGIDRAKGQFITFLDSDDIYYDNALLYRVNFFVHHPNVSATFCETEITDQDLNPLGWVIGRAKQLSFENFHGSPLPINSIMVKSEVVRAVRFDENFTNGEDWLMLSRIARMGIKFHKVNHCRVSYRQHKSTVRKDMLKHENELLRVINILYGKDTDCPNSAERYKYGLKTPEKEKVILKRRFGLLVYLLLSGDFENARKVGEDVSAQDFGRMEMQEQEIVNTFKYSTMRCCLCHEKDWQVHYKERSKTTLPYLKQYLSPSLYEKIELGFKMSRLNHLLLQLKKLGFWALDTLDIGANQWLVEKLLRLEKLIHRKKPFINKNGMLNICYIPGVSDPKEYTDLYCRMVWYLNPLIDNLDKIFIPYSSIDIKNVGVIPDYFDQQINKLRHRFKGKIVYFDERNCSEWEDCLSKSDVLVHWKVSHCYESNVFNDIINKYLSKKKVWRVDPKKMQYESSLYLKISFELNRHYNEDLNDCKSKFEQLCKDVRRSNNDKCYIFGTGPSLQRAMEPEFTFNDGLAIACNSMVKNKKLLQKLQPKIFVAADPVFHAGCSSYAAEFRKHLVEMLDSYKTYFIVPFRDYRLYISILPEKFHDNIIGIPLEHIKRVNLDLTNKFVVKSTSNILTLFLIPLATTFSNNICMIGYDGRKIEENTYFWGHDKDSQFNEKMNDVKLAHPAFFDIDYNAYYFEHCKVLERWLSTGENLGFKFCNLTFSNIPALQKRFINPLRCKS